MAKGKKEVLSGIFWKLSERLLTQVVSTVVAIVLARLLLPSEYGTISLVMVFTNIAGTLMISGFNTSLIQKKDADNIDFSTVFFFSIGVGLLFYAILFVGAIFIADFYQIPVLKPVLQILALGIPVTAINSVQQAYVSRHMLFKRFFLSTFLGTLFSGVIGIYMAYQGYGVYALVAQNLSNTVISTIVLWFTVGWRPKLVFSFQRLRGLFRYGWKLLVQSVILNIYSSLRSLVIGKVYTTEDLAYYTKGSHYPNLIATNVDTALNSVLFPAMADAQSDYERVKMMARRTTQLSSYVMAPILIGMIAVADNFIALLLTEKWLPAVPYLQIICVVLLFVAPQTAMLQAIKAVGRSDVVLKADIPVRIFALAALIISLRFGVIAVAVSEVVATLFGTVIYIIAAKKSVNYAPGELCADFLPNICLAAVMGLATWWSGRFLAVPLLAKLVIQVLFGAICYVGLSVLLKNASFRYILAEINTWRKGSRKAN